MIKDTLALESLLNMALTEDQKNRLLKDSRFQALIKRQSPALSIQEQIRIRTERQKLEKPPETPTLPEIEKETGTKDITIETRKPIRDFLKDAITIKPEQVEKVKKFFEPTKKVRARDVLREAVTFLTESEQKFGQTLGDALAVKSKAVTQAQESQEALDSLNQQVAIKIIELKAQGKDTAKLEQVYKNNTEQRFNLEEIAPSVLKSAKQIFGEGVGVATDIASAGTFGTGAIGARTGRLLKTTKQVAAPLAKTTKQAFVAGAKATAPTGAAVGAGFGLSSALQEDKNLVDITKQTIKGIATGGILSGILGGLSSTAKFQKTERATKLKQKAVEQYKKGLKATKEKQKENVDKIVDELLEKKIFGSRKKLLAKAEKGIALADDEYEKLGELQGFSSSDELLKRVQKLKERLKTKSGKVLSTNKTKFNALQGLEDDIVSLQSYDVLISDLATGELKPSVLQQELRELAQQYGNEVYDTRKSIKTVTDSKTLSQVKNVDSAIRDILSSDPRNVKYTQINKVKTLNSRLKSVLDETINRQSGQLKTKLTDLFGATIGGGLGRLVSLPAAIISTVVGGGLVHMLNSTWWNTMQAVNKAKLADKLLQQSQKQLGVTLQLFTRQGIKAVNEFLER